MMSSLGIPTRPLAARFLRACELRTAEWDPLQTRVIQVESLVSRATEGVTVW